MKSYKTLVFVGARERLWEGTTSLELSIAAYGIERKKFGLARSGPSPSSGLFVEDQCEL